MSFPIALAAEFPNDNPALHEGAIWVNATPCGALVAELVEAVLAEADAAVAEPIAEIADPIAEIAAPAAEIGEPAAEMAVAAAEEIEAAPEPLALDVGDAPMAASVDPIEDDGADIEIVDDLDAIVDEDDEDDSAEIATADDAADDSDPFSIYVRTLTDVMIAAGGSDAAGNLVSALSEEPTARAWRKIISGESEDFTACGAKSLDEWSAELVARLIAMPAKTDQLRRELRARGVAAFGLVV